MDGPQDEPTAIELIRVFVLGFLLMFFIYRCTFVLVRERSGRRLRTLSFPHLKIPPDTMFRRLCISVGGTIDHPLANPCGPCSPNLASTELDPMLVLVGGSEVIKDLVEDYYKKLERMGKIIEYVEYKGWMYPSAGIVLWSNGFNEFVAGLRLKYGFTSIARN